MSTYTLYLITYYRGTYSTTGGVKPYHWSYFIQTQLDAKQNLGYAHQLRGMPGAFYYPGPEHVDRAASGSLEQELEIGLVDVARLARIENILRSIVIVTDEASRWNCQNWALEGFDKLKAEGFIYNHITRDMVMQWLKET